MAKTKKPTIESLAAEIQKLQTRQSELETLLAEQANGKSQLLDAPENMEVATGKLPKEDELLKIKKLEKALAVSQTNPFGTTEISVFEENLQNMNDASLKEMAIKVGVDPYDNPITLRKNLKTAFIQSGAKNALREIPKPKQHKWDLNNPKHLKVMRDLNIKIG